MTWVVNELLLRCSLPGTKIFNRLGVSQHGAARPARGSHCRIGIAERRKDEVRQIADLLEKLLRHTHAHFHCSNQKVLRLIEARPLMPAT